MNFGVALFKKTMITFSGGNLSNITSQKDLNSPYDPYI